LRDTILSIRILRLSPMLEFEMADFFTIALISLHHKHLHACRMPETLFKRRIQKHSSLQE
jgi:hypothetical protein